MIAPRPRRRPDWSVLPPPHPLLRVSVVVPVKDEARRLPGALRALAGQRLADGTRWDPARYEVIVLANNCSDASADVVRRSAARHPGVALHVVEVRFAAAVAHVGHARSCLMDEACRRLLRTAGATGVIASTDGDTRVAKDWLAATLREVDAGADAVGGRIVNGDDVELPPRLVALARRDALYQRLRVRLETALDPDPADPWPRHHQHFGASLAITVAAYRRVGGMPAEPFLEDEALYRRLRQYDMNVRHSDRVTVVTSSRRRGRVAVGLSWQLREWQACVEAGREPTVADPHVWAAALAWRQRLRAAWRLRAAGGMGASPRVSGLERALLVELAERLGRAPARVAREWRQATSFGAFWHAVEPRLVASAPRSPSSLPMRDAVAELRVLIGRLRVTPETDKGTTLAARSERHLLKENCDGKQSTEHEA